jgi:sugar O-acyltransferase (sialic acid O-acetyltransferase NeuD family)
MKRLIVGTGGFGRELCELLALHANTELVGFLDDRPPDPSGPALIAPYIGAIASPQHRAVPCIVGVGYPSPKRAALTAMQEVGRPLAGPLLHPRAELGRNVEVADGVLVTAGVVATTNIKLARCVSLHPGALLGHDVTCEQYVSVMPGAAVSGNVTLEEGVFVGTNAAILQGVTVGAWATIGAGAVVTKDVAPGSTVVGVPARPLA